MEDLRCQQQIEVPKLSRSTNEPTAEDQFDPLISEPHREHHQHQLEIRLSSIYHGRVAGQPHHRADSANGRASILSISSKSFQTRFPIPGATRASSASAQNSFETQSPIPGPLIQRSPTRASSASARTPFKLSLLSPGL